jgi:hypothetical protein
VGLLTRPRAAVLSASTAATTSSRYPHFFPYQPAGHTGGHWTGASCGSGGWSARSHGRQRPPAFWLYVPDVPWPAISLTRIDTFSADYINLPTDQDNAGQSLLSDMENQGLADFFTRTHWNDFDFPSAQNTSEIDDALAWQFQPPPATVHSVTTTIPDQAQLHGFPPNNGFHSAHAAPFASTADDLQAASTLFHNAHMPPPTPRSASFSVPTNGQPSSTFAHLPMVHNGNGMMQEQLASFPLHHQSQGSIERAITPQWASSPVQHQHDPHLRGGASQRPPLKRSYTYGSDSNFHESGFQVSSKYETEAFAVSRLMGDLRHAQPITRDMPSEGDVKYQPSPVRHAPPAAEEDELSTDDEDDDGDFDEDDDSRPSKRRKSKVSRPRNGKSANGSRKGVSGAKNRKASVDERASKKKRGSVAGSKAQRENLSEEQKRNNHILSEQKRRNQIKNGFNDLHDLVPAIRSAGLNKAGILTETANFLDKLVADNAEYAETVGSGG